jgi:signal transduction histidine kinase
MKRFPLLFILAGMAIAVLLAVGYIGVVLQPPAQDVQLLVLFMTGSGLLTVVLAYVLYRRGLVRWLPSLRWTLLTIVLITVLLILLNVWFTAQLMFISEHDLVLTVALLLFAGLTAFNFGLFIASTLIDRIGDLSSAVDGLAKGRLDTRLDVKGTDELAQLATTFNAMADSLQKVEAQKRLVEQTRQLLIAGVSHDLRTPLTSVRVMLEAMADDVVTDAATVTRYLDSSLAELQHLERLIADLFDLAKLDAGQLDVQREPASLADLAEATVRAMTPRAAQHQITLRHEIAPGLPAILLAPDKIQRVLHNLLDNALRYTPAGGTITLRVRQAGDGLQVDVHNTGPAIPADDLPHLFNSFYRGEESRTQAVDGYRGTGLGLAIAHGFVEAHGGTIGVASAPEQGTVFSFSLPED